MLDKKSKHQFAYTDLQSTAGDFHSAAHWMLYPIVELCLDSKNCSWPLTKYTPLAFFMHFLQNAYIAEDDSRKLPQMHSKFKNAFPNDKTCAEFSKISFRWKIASACEIHIVNALSCLDVPPFTTSTDFPTMDMWTTWSSNFVEMCSF